MMLFPGIAIAALTFPGVIVHEFAHQLVCWLLRIPVLEVCYFRFRLRGPVGYVRHEAPRSGWASLIIGVAPFAINTILGILIALPAVIHSTLGIFSGRDLFLGWLGISIAMHSFPSTGDAASIWKSVMGPKNSVLEKMIAVPLVGIIWIGAVGSVFWLDAIYGVFVTCFVPGILINLLASI